MTILVVARSRNLTLLYGYDNDNVLTQMMNFIIIVNYYVFSGKPNANNKKRRKICENALPWNSHVFFSYNF